MGCLRWHTSTAARAVLLFTIVHVSSGALQLSSCVERLVTLESPPSNQYSLHAVRCFFNEDLYFKSAQDPSVVLKSTANRQEIATAIGASAVLGKLPAQQQKLLNWEMPYIEASGGPSMAFPNQVRTWSGNLKLKCDDVVVPSVAPAFGPPSTFIWMAPPHENPVNDVMQAFGAHRFPQDKVERSLTFAFMTAGIEEDRTGTPRPISGVVDEPKFQQCLVGGRLEVIVDPVPFDQNSVWGPFWYLSDAAGKQLTSGKITITKEELTCDKSRFSSEIVPMFAKLYTLLDEASSLQQGEAARMTYNAIKEHKVYAGCKAILETFYTTETRSVLLKGVKACVNPNDGKDPCCNETLSWSSCCLPSDKEVSLRGVFKESASSEIQAKCGAAATIVEEVISSIFGESLLNAQHPEHGCDAVANRAVGRERWDQATAPAHSCIQAVFEGTPKSGRNCNSDSDCWTGSCSNPGPQGKCARALGDAVAEPLLACLVEKLEGDLLKHMFRKLNVVPSQVNANTLRSSNAWIDAVSKVSNEIGSPNCAGEQADSGWCVLEGVDAATCTTLNSHTVPWMKQFAWVDDTTTAAANDGFCKLKYIAGTLAPSIYGDTSDEDKSQACQDYLRGLAGVCTGGPGDADTDGACSGGGGTWVSFASKTGRWYRLAASSRWMRNETTGNYEQITTPGSQSLCELEKRCNWDPMGTTATDEASCVGYGEMQEGGVKKFCARCWGSHCEEFHASYTSKCGVAVWHGPGCAANTGGGPGKLPPVVARSPNYMKPHGHMQCLRSGPAFDTAEECLPAAVCPALQVSGPEDHSCAENFCFSSETQSVCESPAGEGTWRWWSQDKARGNGLCVYWKVSGSPVSKSRSACEAAGQTWWEGRVWVPGSFDSQQTCSSFCDDHSWPPKQQCDAGSFECSARCRRCAAREGAMCLLESANSYSDCSQAQGGYDWDERFNLCKKGGWSNGNTAAMCVALGPNHTYHSCAGYSKAECSAYCWAQEYGTEDACNAASGLRWEWSLKRCLYESWQEEGYNAARCAAAGKTSWVDASSDVATSTLKVAMGCMWDDYATCVSESSCTESGECEDWFMYEPGCLVQANEAGNFKGCDQMVGPGGAPYEWANEVFCRAKKREGGQDVPLTEAECAAEGGMWRTGRAETSSECESYGSSCRHKYRHWDVKGGFASQQECKNCDMIWERNAHWRQSVWAPARSTPLRWMSRAYAPVNEWHARAFDWNKFHDWIDGSMGRLFAQAYKTQIMCKLGPYAAAMPVIADCTGGGSAGSGGTAVEYQLAADVADCSSMSSQAPIKSGSLQVEFSGSQCEGTAKFSDVSVQRVVGAASSSRRLGGRELSEGAACASHELVKTKGGTLIGQKVGNGVRVAGANNVNLCLGVTVPAGEQCAVYSQKAVSTVGADGSYGPPLAMTVTLNKQGQYCVSGAQAGVSYAPVLVLPNWDTITPTATTTIAPGANTAEVVKVTMTIANVNYQQLIADDTLKSAFESSIKQAVLTSTPSGITEEHIRVQLSAGSVKADVTITPPASVSVASLETTMQSSSTQGALSQKVVEKVSQVAGISAVSTGTIGVSGLGVERQTQTKSSGSASVARPAAAPALAALAVLSLIAVQYSLVR